MNENDVSEDENISPSKELYLDDYNVRFLKREITTNQIISILQINSVDDDD